MKKKINYKKKQFLLIIILLIIAVVLGYAIYKQQDPKSPSVPDVSIPTPSVSTQISSALNADEKAVLNPPPSDASPAEREEHDALAAKLSKESDNLDITNCRPNPLVLRIQINKNLKVKNSDNINHKLIFDDTHQYQIPKNSTIDIKVDFGHGAGLYGYVCEGVGLTGFILVTTP